MLRKIRLALSGALLAVALYGALDLGVRAQDATSSLLQLLYMGAGLHLNDWGAQTNTNLSKIESAVAGVTTITVGALDYTLSDTEARSHVLVITGTLSNALNVIVPARTKSWIVSNQTTGGFAITLKPSGGTGLTVPAAASSVIWTDGAATRIVPDLTSVNASISSVTSVANAALPKAGGTMTGAINLGGFTLASGGAPSATTDMTTKAYVDAAISSAIAGIPTSTIPSGAVMAFNLSACPSGWLAANGTATALDLRGEFIRGLDSGRGVDSGRALASAQSDLVKDHTHANTVGGSLTQPNSGLGANGYYMGNASTSGSMTSGGGAETRPRNVALLYCVKS